MNGFKNFFAERWGIIGAGVLIGILAPLLQKLGNPGNMGVCVACFERDIARAPSVCTGPMWFSTSVRRSSASS